MKRPTTAASFDASRRNADAPAPGNGASAPANDLGTRCPSADDVVSSVTRRSISQMTLRREARASFAWPIRCRSSSLLPVGAEGDVETGGFGGSPDGGGSDAATGAMARSGGSGGRDARTGNGGGVDPRVGGAGSCDGLGAILDT